MSTPSVNLFFSATAAFAAFQHLSMLPELVGETDNRLPTGDTYRVKRTITLTFQGAVLASNVFEQTCSTNSAFRLHHALSRFAAVLTSSIKAEAAPYEIKVSIGFTRATAHNEED